MTELRLNITMSLDGYVAGPTQSVTHPLGQGGEQLHEWAFATRTFRAIHGMEGGATGPDDDIAKEYFHNVGATIMGRRMFGGGDGAWRDNPWNGWWGENPPFHTPVFVVTHHARKPLEMRGGTTFHFVTDGIHAALDRAKDAAQGKSINLGGGADIAQQYLKAGLVDEMDLHIVPVLLGDGIRLFDNAGGRQVSYECVRVVNSSTVSHYKYRPKKSTTLPHQPEAWPRVFEEHLNAGDLAAVMDLYEPEAQFVTRSGETLVGRDRIREPLATMIRSKTKLHGRVIKTVTVGDIAQLYTDFEGTALDGLGKTVEVRHKAVEVLRRQPDGTWKLIMGDPNGRE